MTNPFYNASGAPTTGSQGLSSVIRSEFLAIAAGFALLPLTLTPNAAVVVNGGGTALIATASPSMTFGDGAVGTPSISFAADTDCGIYRIGTDDWALANNGIKTLELTALNKVIVSAGLLGIGADPGAFPLYISVNAATLEQFVFSNTTAAGGVGIELLPNTGALIMQMMGSTFGGMTYGSVTGNSQVVIEADGATSFYIGTSPACPIIFAQNRFECARFDTTGNLRMTNLIGVGMTPVNPVDVSRSSSNTVPKISIVNPAVAGTGGAGFQALADVSGLVLNAFSSGASGTTYGGVTGSNQVILEASGASTFYIGTSNNTCPIIFAQNRAEVARLFTAGGLGINTKVQSLFASSGFPLICGLTDSGGRGIRLGTSDWNNSNTGSFLLIEFNAGSGNTDAIIRCLTAGGSAAGNVVLAPGTGERVGIGKFSPARVLDIDASVTNAAQDVRLTNSNTGNASNAALSAFNASHGVELVMYGSGWTTSGLTKQDGALLYTNGAGGLTIGTTSNTALNFATNSIVNAQLTAHGALNAGSGVTASVATSTYITLFNASGFHGCITVFAWLDNVSDVTNYGAVYYLLGDGNVLNLVPVHVPGLMSMALSGSNVQALQGSGQNQVINWAFTQMGL